MRYSLSMRVLPLLCLLAACAPATSTEVRAPKPWETGRATMQIDKIWPAYGTYVQLHDGRTFVVFPGAFWPQIVTGEHPCCGPLEPTYRDLLASVKATKPSANVPASEIEWVVHVLTVAPVVIDRDWSDVELTKITRNGGAFSLSLRKQQMALSGDIVRRSSHDYRPNWQHWTEATVERFSIEAPTFASYLDHAKIGGDVDRAILADATRLLRKPGSESQEQND